MTDDNVNIANSHSSARFVTEKVIVYSICISIVYRSIAAYRLIAGVINSFRFTQSKDNFSKRIDNIEHVLK